MNHQNKTKKSSTFREKVRHSFMILLIIVFAIFGVIEFVALEHIQERMAEYNLSITGELTDISTSANDHQIRNTLKATTSGMAKHADNTFKSLQDNVLLMTDTAEYLYKHASAYGDIYVSPPRKEDADRLALQVTYSAKIDPADSEILKEQGLLGNLGGLLMSVKQNDDKVTSAYIATESGIMIQADELAGYQFDENGNILTFEAKERLWYQGALTTEKDKVYFTDVMTDFATGKLAIVCSSPVYQGKTLKGVVAAGMLLEELQETVHHSSMSKNSNCFILDQQGNVICSSSDEGELVFTEKNLNNLLDNGNAELKTFLNNFVQSGESSSIEKVTIDGQTQYICCVLMKNINWIYANVIPEAEVIATTEALRKELDILSMKLMTETSDYLKNTLIWVLGMFPVVILISFFLTSRLTSKLVAPINALSKKVSDLDGENLNFEWEYYTGDEIDLLAKAFCKLTFRVQEYIKDITAITAEKERIGAELSVATQIQADMLPIVFPPFPERTEFEIYASMTPAKEVGGDFYDFFMLDEDHLAMVIADVSGKGVPAALFMVISKTLIKDHAQMCCSPKAILEKVNNLLLESNAEGMFVTVWLGILEISTGKIVAANAGHEYPALQSANGNFELIKDKHGMMVGAMGGIHYKEYEMQIEKGGCLFVYTDGVPEATNANNELYGTERMILALNQNPQADPKTLLSNVRADVDKFVGTAPQFDDLTMLSIRYFGKSE